MTTKIFLIEHENSFLGYQAFKEVSGKMQFICDLEFLEPLEIIETYDEENETLIFNYYIPLLNALERSSIDSIEFEIKDKHTFIIAEENLNKLLKCLYKAKVSQLKKTATEYRGKAEAYIKEFEREISEMVF